MLQLKNISPVRPLMQIFKSVGQKYWRLDSIYVLRLHCPLQNDPGVFGPTEWHSHFKLFIFTFNSNNRTCPRFTSLSQQKCHGRPVSVLRNLVDSSCHSPNIPTKPCKLWRQSVVNHVNLAHQLQINEFRYSRFAGGISRLGKPIPCLQVLNELSTELHSLIWWLSKGEYFAGRDAKSPHVRPLGKLPCIFRSSMGAHLVCAKTGNSFVSFLIL